MIRLVLADDQAVVRKTLKFHLDSETDMEVVGEAEDGQQAIDQVDALQPDVILLDLDMPGMDGLSAAEVIRKNHANVKVLVLTSHEDEEYLNQALQIGIQGYFLKTTPTTELANAVRTVHKGFFSLRTGGL